MWQFHWALPLPKGNVHYNLIAFWGQTGGFLGTFGPLYGQTGCYSGLGGCQPVISQDWLTIVQEGRHSKEEPNDPKGAQIGAQIAQSNQETKHVKDLS